MMISTACKEISVDHMSVYCVAEMSTEANPASPVSLNHFVPARGDNLRAPVVSAGRYMPAVRVIND